MAPPQPKWVSCFVFRVLHTYIVLFRSFIGAAYQVAKGDRTLTVYHIGLLRGNHIYAGGAFISLSYACAAYISQSYAGNALRSLSVRRVAHSTLVACQQTSSLVNRAFSRIIARA